MQAREYLEWLSHEIDLYDRYHDHKEMMAWTATAFYLPGILAAGYYASSVHTNCGVNLLFTLGFLVVAWLTLRFVNMQFKMRWESANTGIGLRRVVAKLCANPQYPPVSERDIEERPEGGVRVAWPRFVQAEIDAEDEREPRNWRQAVKAVRDLFLPWKGLDNRWKTELACYGLILVATAAAVALVWA